MDQKTDSTGGEIYTIGVRNIDLLGSTGLWLPPTNPPYVAITNSWLIEVEGEYVSFKVTDVTNKAYLNITSMQYEPQVYVREEAAVVDPLTGEVIGYNKPLKFGFITGTMILTPFKPPGIGDPKNELVESSKKFG